MKFLYNLIQSNPKEILHAFKKPIFTMIFGVILVSFLFVHSINYHTQKQRIEFYNLINAETEILTLQLNLESPTLNQKEFDQILSKLIDDRTKKKQSSYGDLNVYAFYPDHYANPIISNESFSFLSPSYRSLENIKKIVPIYKESRVSSHDLEWVLLWIPSIDVVSGHLDASSWIVLIAGLMIVVSFSYIIFQSTFNEHQTMLEIDQQTDVLQRHKKQLQNFFDHAVDGLITIDEYGNIESFNMACERMFGYGESEVKGQNVKLLMPPSYGDYHDGYLKNYRSTGIKKIIGIGRKVQGKRKDGSIFPMHLSVSEINYENERKFCAIIQDITRQVALEKNREETIIRLQESNKELERFAYICSHDMQEPLRNIVNYSKKLDVRLVEYGNNDERTHKYLAYIMTSTKRLSSLIHGILEYSKLTTIDQTLMKDINLNEVCQDVLRNLDILGNELEKSIEIDEFPHVMGEKTQLTQLLQNLVNNAIKFSEKGQKIKIGYEVMENEHVIYVQDQGIGISPQHQEKIFELFARLNAKDHYEGSGIGLALCAKIVKNHRGHIWLKSEIDEGSCFYFTLPKNSEKKVTYG